MMTNTKLQEHTPHTGMRIGATIAYGILIAAVATCVAGIGIWSVASTKKQEKQLLLDQVYEAASNNNTKDDIIYYALASNLLNVASTRCTAMSLEGFVKMIHNTAIPQITKQGEILIVKDLSNYMQYNNSNRRYIECMLYFSVDIASTNKHKRIDNVKFVNMIDNLVTFDTSKFYSQCILHKNIRHTFHLKYLFALYNSMIEMYTRMSKILMETMCVVCPQYLQYYCEHILSTK